MSRLLWVIAGAVACVIVGVIVGGVLSQQRWKRTRPDVRQPVTLWQLVGVLLIGLAAVGGSIWASLALLNPAATDRSDAIRSVGFAAAAVVAVPVGYIAYRRQRILEQQHALADTKDFRDRFESAATQLGSTNMMARMAGVYAMANLADDWGLVSRTQRQMCIDVLCAYIRTPFDPIGDNQITGTTTETTHQDDGLSGLFKHTVKNTETRTALYNDVDVRRTIIRIITEHLRENSTVHWQGNNFDFNGATFFDNPNFGGATFTSGKVDFSRAKFPGFHVNFSNVKFTGANVTFDSAHFTGAVSFNDAQFTGGTISFLYTDFADGTVTFDNAKFNGASVNFGFAHFGGNATIHFRDAEFDGGNVNFEYANFTNFVLEDARYSLGGTVTFFRAHFTGSTVDFHHAHFSGGRVDFREAEFAGGTVDFRQAQFEGGTDAVEFDPAFIGETVDFSYAQFSGGTVDFHEAEFTGGNVVSRRGLVLHPPVIDLAAVLGFAEYDPD